MADTVFTYSYSLVVTSLRTGLSEVVTFGAPALCPFWSTAPAFGSPGSRSPESIISLAASLFIGFSYAVQSFLTEFGGEYGIMIPIHKSVHRCRILGYDFVKVNYNRFIKILGIRIDRHKYGNHYE